MKRTTTFLAAVSIGAAATGIITAPLAAADSGGCQTIGASTVCGQGDVKGGDQPAGAPSAPAPDAGGGGCLTPYGTYQNCGTNGG